MGRRQIEELLITFVVYFALVTIVECQRQVPKPCCFAPQFEVVRTSMLEYYSRRLHHYVDRDGTETYSTDFLNRRMAVQRNYLREDGTLTKQRDVYDYSKGLEYSVYENNTCRMRNLTSEMTQPCIHGDSQFVGMSYYGYGPSKLELMKFRHDIPNTDKVVHYEVLPNGCVPVLRWYEGHYRNTSAAKSVTMWVYLNFEAGIRDRAVFDVPGECEKDNPDNILVAIG